MKETEKEREREGTRDKKRQKKKKKRTKTHRGEKFELYFYVDSITTIRPLSTMKSATLVGDFLIVEKTRKEQR